MNVREALSRSSGPPGPPARPRPTMRGPRAVPALLCVLALAGCSLVGGGKAPAPGGRPGGEVVPPGAPRPVAPGVEYVPPARRFREVRGLWVVRSTMTSSREIRTMVSRAADAGFNTLIVQVRGRADAFYRSRWEPPGRTLPGGDNGFDPLALVIQEAHRRGLAVHAWVNTHLVWGMGELPARADHMVRAHPEWLAVPRELGRALFDADPTDPKFVEALHTYAQEHRDRVEGIYSSPSHPAVKERVYAVWMNLVDHYDLDGIHFDYVRYPSGAFDYSRGALERFRVWVRSRLSPERRRALEAAYRNDPYAYADALPGPWGEFRRAQITDLVERIYYGVKARKPEVVVSAAVFANAADAYGARFQDWKRWLARGILDVVVPMAYTTDDARFRSQIEEARKAAGVRSRVWAGIGAFRNTFQGTVDKIEIARKADAGGVVLFSYDWTVQQDARARQGEAPYLIRIARAAFGRR